MTRMARIGPAWRSGFRANLDELLWWFAFGLLAASFVTVFWLDRANDRLRAGAPAHAEPAWGSVLDLATGIVLLGAAAILIRRRRRHPIGWLLLAMCVLGLLSGVAEQVASNGLYLPRSGVTDPAAWAVIGQSLERPEFGAVFLILLLFPTGQLPSRRWRPIAWAVVVVFAGWFLLHLLSPGALTEDPFTGVDNPLGQSFLANAVLRHSATPIAAGLGIACVASLVGRFRRSTGDERQQLKWVGFAAAGAPVCLAAVAVAALFGSAAMNAVGNGMYLVVGLVLPVAVVVAITKYRMYDLDLVVNRTIVYGTLCVILVGTYAAVVLAVTRVLVSAGWTSPWVVAAATLAAAAVAAPARNRIQRLVDRVFARRAWDARRQIETFAAVARREPLPPTALRDVLAGACDDPTLQLGLWIRGPARYVGPDGGELQLPDSGQARSVFKVGGVDTQPLAVLITDRVPGRDQRLLTTVADAAGLLLENGRLRAELLAQLVEVQQSRARIVQAADAERRRVERDLHDGAQQRLVALALQIKLASRAGHGSGLPGELLTQLGSQVQATLTELRDLARGIHPTDLDEGLGPALETVTGRLPIEVRVAVPAVRMPPLVELTGYYVACEAITNAVKHAGAQHVEVVAEHQGGRLTLQVLDDGVGGARATPGSGLAGLIDRVSAVGGLLEIASEPGAGTRIMADLPCGC